MILLLVLDVPVLVVLLAIVLVIAVVAVLWLGDCRVTPDAWERLRCCIDFCASQLQISVVTAQNDP